MSIPAGKYYIGVVMNVFEQMVNILVSYEGKPLSPRKVNIQSSKK